MPRVNLRRCPEEVRRDAARKVILKKMIDRDVKTQKALCERIDMPKTTMSKRMAEQDWTLPELVKLASTLQMSCEDAGRLLGIIS